MAMAWQRTRINLPARYSKSDRVAIASEIIDFIRERSQSGRGINPNTGRNKRFVRYTDEYAKREGKTNVDLTLNDEMLRAMRLISDRPDSLLIGYENGTEENAKAEGNQIGSYGRSPNPEKARPFLGITNADLNRILAKYDEVEQ